jgi:hypothetical protein
MRNGMKSSLHKVSNVTWVVLVHLHVDFNQFLVGRDKDWLGRDATERENRRGYNLINERRIGKNEGKK